MYIPNLSTLIDALACLHDSLFSSENDKTSKSSKEAQGIRPTASELVVLDNDASRGEYFFKEDPNNSFNLASEPREAQAAPKLPVGKKNMNQMSTKPSIATPAGPSYQEIGMVVIDEVGALVYDLDKGFDHCTPASKALGSILAKITREKYIPILINSSIAISSEEVKVGLSPWANFTGDTIIMEKCIFKEPYDPVKTEANIQDRKPAYQVKKVVNSGLAGFYMQVPAESKVSEGLGDVSRADTPNSNKAREFVLKFRVKVSLLSQAHLPATRIELNFEKKLHMPSQY